MGSDRPWFSASPPRHHLRYYGKCVDNRSLPSCFRLTPCAVKNGVRGHQRYALVFAVYQLQNAAKRFVRMCPGNFP